MDGSGLDYADITTPDGDFGNSTMNPVPPDTTTRLARRVQFEEACSAFSTGYCQRNGWDLISLFLNYKNPKLHHMLIRKKHLYDIVAKYLKLNCLAWRLFQLWWRHTGLFVFRTLSKRVLHRGSVAYIFGCVCYDGRGSDHRPTDSQ